MSGLNTNKATVKYFLRHAWRYKGLFVGTIIGVPLSNLFLWFLPPLLVAEMFRRIESGDFASGDLMGSFGGLLIPYAVLVFLGGVILWRITVYFIWKLEIRVLRDIHREIFDHYLKMSSTFHANHFGGSLVSRANKLAGAYVRFADTSLFVMYGLLLSFAFSMAILLPRAATIAVLLLLFSALFMALATRITRKVRELSAESANMQNKQTGFLADAVTNVLAIKGFSGGAFERKRYAAATANTADADTKVMRASILRDTAFGFGTTAIGVTALFFAIGGVVLDGADVGTAFLIVTYTGIITQRLWDFSQNVLRNYNRALGDSKEMIETLATPAGIKDPERPERPRIKQGKIELHNMTFAHPDASENEALFVNTNLAIPPGQRVGLVGHSGSGKTTLTKLLLRFNDIDGGEILIDGQNIARITQDDLRRNIAYVPQEPLLFHRSIRENIAYGKPDASEEEIVRAAQKANAAEFIEKLPNAYGTLVGERGVKLSGGQRQRIAIARAILKDAPILILDEATSALDSESELLIQDALWKLMKGRTAIVIAHRLSTIQKMDRIVVLENGEIIEQGDHKELLEKKGAYARLWQHQSGGFLEE